jgi:hypothetical protein
MLIRLLISLVIYLLCWPFIVLGFPIVALLLLTSWSGRTTIFGNQKHGMAVDHPAYQAKTYWDKFLWLAWRNPVNNLFHFLGCWHNPALIKTKGDLGIGDKTRGGFYYQTMGMVWSIYWVKPYTIGSERRCVRLRAGWKIDGGKGICDFVFVFNPWKEYAGA